MRFLGSLLGSVPGGWIFSAAAVAGTAAWYGGNALVSTILPVLRLSPSGKTEKGLFAVGYRQNIGGWLKVPSGGEETYIPPFSVFYPIDNQSLRSSSGHQSEKYENINNEKNTSSSGQGGKPSWCPFNDGRFATSFGNYTKLPEILFHRWIAVTMDCVEGASLINDARVLNTPRVVIFCHGLAGHQNCYSLLAMEMASRGYIVICPTFLDGSALFAKFRVPNKIQGSNEVSTGDKEELVSMNNGESESRLKDISHLLLSPGVLGGYSAVADPPDPSVGEKEKINGMCSNNKQDLFTILYRHPVSSATADQVRDLREQQEEVRERTIDVFRKVLGNTNEEGVAFFSEFLNTCNTLPYHSSPHTINNNSGENMRDRQPYRNFLTTAYGPLVTPVRSEEGVVDIPSSIVDVKRFANEVAKQGVCMTGHSFGAATALQTTLNSAFQKQEEEKRGLIYVRCTVLYDTWWLPVVRRVDQLLLLTASNGSSDVCVPYTLPPLVLADSEVWQSMPCSVSLVGKLKKLWGTSSHDISSSVCYFPKDLISSDKFVVDWEKNEVNRGVERRTTFTCGNHDQRKTTEECTDSNRGRCHYIVFEAIDHVTFSDVGPLMPYLTWKRLTTKQHPDEMRIGIFADLLAQIDHK